MHYIKASDIIRDKLIKAGGIATVHMLNGKPFDITLSDDKKAFKTDKHPKDLYCFKGI